MLLLPLLLLTAPQSHFCQVVDLFFAHNVRHVPVIDGGTLMGVISARDMLRGLLE